MKKLVILFWFFVTICPLLIAQSSTEELPYSIIYIIRSKNYYGSACRTDITVSNQRSFNLSHNSVVEYKVYSEGEVTITQDLLCPNGGISKSLQVILNVKRGFAYYILSTGTSFKLSEKIEVEKYIDDKNISKQKQVEDLDFPINRTSLKNIVKKEGKGQGTCFLISSDGYLITNYHCVANAKEITIRGIGDDFSTKYAAIIIASDPSNDLALLKLVNKNLTFSPLPFDLRSFGVAQGERIYALGFPIAITMGEEMKITEGIISAKSGAQGDISKFQISAAVNPGNSGGPLIDESGSLIGVIYAKSTVAESAGYAIKAGYLKTFLENTDGFIYPTYINSIKDKSLPDKLVELKKYIFIVEAN